MNQPELKLPSNPIQEFVASKQTQLFQSLKQSQFTGELWLRNTQQQEWVFYFYLGRILYATGGIHPVRRWKRQVKLYFPELVSNLTEQIGSVFHNSVNVCWEYDLLCSFWHQKLVTREQLINMTKVQLTEILFDLTQTKQITYNLKYKKFNSTRIILVDPEQVIVEAWKLWQNWQYARIADRSPNSAPVIIQPEQLRLRTSPKTYQALTQLLTKKRSLRDLAVKLNQDVLQLVRLLTPYIQFRLVELVDIPDLKLPNPAKVVNSNKLLIISIFQDSVFSKDIEPVIKETGSYYININDGLESISHLAELKPDLLLIEWEIVKNGRSETFSKLVKLKEIVKTPVILCMKKPGFLEELKAKSAGCDQLLLLPVSPTTFVDTIKQYFDSYI